jgi:hypothetical protein
LTQWSVFCRVWEDKLRSVSASVSEIGIKLEFVGKVQAEVICQKLLQSFLTTTCRTFRLSWRGHRLLSEDEFRNGFETYDNKNCRKPRSDNGKGGVTFTNHRKNDSITEPYEPVDVGKGHRSSCRMMWVKTHAW